MKRFIALFFNIKCDDLHYWTEPYTGRVLLAGGMTQEMVVQRCIDCGLQKVVR